MGGFISRPLPRPSYRPPPVDIAVEARTVRRTLRDANTRQGDQLLDYAMVRAGFIPGLDDYLHPVNPYLGQGEKSSGTFAMTLLTTLTFLGAAGLALEVAKPFQPAKAQASDYASEKLVQESSGVEDDSGHYDDEVKSLHVSPTGKTVVYTKLAEPPVSGQTEKTQMKQVDVQTKQKGSIDAGPSDRGSAFDSSGKPVYVKTTDSFHSELRVKGNGSGPDKVLDSCDSCQIHSPQNGNNDIFFGKDSKNPDGSVSSEILRKSGANGTTYILEKGDSDVFKVSLSNRVAVLETDGSLKMMDYYGVVKRTLQPHGSARIGVIQFGQFGYDKLLLGELDELNMILYQYYAAYTEEGHDGAPVLKVPREHFRGDFEWKSEQEISYLDENGNIIRASTDKPDCSEMFFNKFDVKDHAWRGNELFVTDGMAIYKLTSPRFSQPVSCNFNPNVKRLELPFYDAFDGLKIKDEWLVTGDVRVESEKLRLKKGSAILGVDMPVVIGEEFHLTDYLFSMEFLKGSLSPEKTFTLKFGTRASKSPNYPLWEVPAYTTEFKINPNGTLKVDVVPHPPSISGENVKHSSDNLLLSNNQNHVIGLAVPESGTVRVYFDGKQILAGVPTNSISAFTSGTLPTRLGAGSVIISGDDLTIDNVAVERWHDRPPVVRVPALLPLMNGKENRLVLNISDPDGDQIMTELYGVGGASYQIRKVSETEYAIKPLTNSSGLLKVKVKGAGEYNIATEVIAGTGETNATNMIKKPTQQKPSGINPIPILAGGGALGAIAVGGYVLRRRAYQRRPDLTRVGGSANLKPEQSAREVADRMRGEIKDKEGIEEEVKRLRAELFDLEGRDKK